MPYLIQNHRCLRRRLQRLCLFSSARGAVLKNTVVLPNNTAPTITPNLVQLCLHHSPSSTGERAHPKKSPGPSQNHRQPSRKLPESVFARDLHAAPPAATASTRPRCQFCHLFFLPFAIERFSGASCLSPTSRSRFSIIFAAEVHAEALPRASTTCCLHSNNVNSRALFFFDIFDALVLALALLRSLFFQFRDNGLQNPAPPCATRIDISPFRSTCAIASRHYTKKKFLDCTASSFL